VHASDEVRNILPHRLSNVRDPVNYIEYEAAVGVKTEELVSAAVERGVFPAPER